ncbi:WXG100 family type VII secretion target [Kibdelosporangium aridum]|uniref:WXG100 family type VII secretion target n=1 Tax=Kibdelosporangium aridum TaxID=2030 RepID=A0A1Y5Y176_KIBAR|nr:hypothetical protein [Kibdelosporangium aridum]SMD23591.1 hypothetical protein SAMN05661093_08114 [Kibdelosporangium aridum]
MPIDTRIAGNPESVRGVSHWLRGSLAKELSEAASQIYAARNQADSGWRGAASAAFRAKMTDGAQKTDGLATAASDVAQKFDDFAAQLHRAQEDMRTVRANAAAAGLKVDGDTILEPGPPPPTPPAADAATPEAVKTHDDAVSAQRIHAAQVDAYKAAEKGAEAARIVAKLAADTLKNVLNDVSSKWFLVIGDLANGAGGTLAAAHASILMQQSKHLAGEAARYLEMAKTAPAGSSAATIYRDFDASRVAAHSADEAAAAAAKTEATAGRVGLKVGGALAVAGVVYDVVATDKPVGQAIVSGAAGFGASVLAGAVIGTAIPVPVVGTALGAVGGALAGLFTSGAVDAIYQNGIGTVGDAIEAGAATVANAAKAVGGALGDAWDAIF